MAITVVQVVGASPIMGTSVTVSFSGTVTNGNTVFVTIATNGGTITGVTDNYGNSYQDDTAGGVTLNSTGTAIWRSISVTGGSGFTVTVTFSSSTSAEIGLTEASGVSTSPSVETLYQHTGNGTSTPTGAIDPVSNGNLVIALVDAGASVTYTTPSGYTFIYSPILGHSDHEYKIAPSTGNFSPSWSWTGAQDYSVGVISYQAQSAPTPDKPPTKQRSQQFDLLQDFNSWWQQQRRWPVPIGGSTKPQRNKRLEESHPQLISDSDFPYQEQRRWPVPILGPLVPPKLLERRYTYELPNYEDYWQQQRRFQPISSSFLVSQEGVFGIYNSMYGVVQINSFRVQNLSMEGYEVFVGSGALPDLTQPPAAFSPNLPISIAATPPVSGLLTYYILVRFRDSYGLESQNQHYSTVTIDSSGNIYEPPISNPQTLQLIALPEYKIKVLATYPGYGVDEFPATHWRVYCNTVPPVPGVDPETAVVLVTGKTLTVTLGSFAPGTYYVNVLLYRSTDNTVSSSLTGSITLTVAPDEVIAVRSGFDLP